MFWNKYPYTDYHELNLDWVIEKVHECVKKVSNVESTIETVTSEILTAWLNDGTIENLINEEIFNDLNERLNDEIAARISADEALSARINNIDSLYDKLNGKIIIALGDSLIEGSHSAYHNTWLEMLATKYGAIVYNYGVSGSKISIGGNLGSTVNDMANRIDNILANHSTCDYFILEGGANDKNYNVLLGNIDSVDSNDFIGAVKNILVKVQRQYGKTCQVLAMTTYHRYNDYNALGYNEIDYVNAMKRACSYLSIPCFDNYSGAGISLADNPYSNPQNNWADVGLVENLGSRSYHFSVAAYEYLMPKYAAYLGNGYIGSNGKPQPKTYKWQWTDTSNITWTAEFIKSYNDDGTWSVTGRIYSSGAVSFNNQVASGDEWYYSNTIMVSLPKELKFTRIIAPAASVRVPSGFVTLQLCDNSTDYLGIRLLRFKSSAALNINIGVYWNNILPRFDELT